jgi:membrane-bound ClpP family serine protease
VSALRDTVVTYAPALVYVVLLYLGANVLLSAPATPLRHVPFLVGVALVVHALFAENLDPVAYAIAGMAFVLAGFVAVAAVAAATSLSLPPVVTDDVTVAVVLTLTLVGWYGWFAGRSSADT